MPLADLDGPLQEYSRSGGPGTAATGGRRVLKFA